jgi:hypothetical protein
MVNGLQVDVQSSELKKIIQSRIDYHTERAALYEAKANEIRKSLEGVEENTIGKVSNGSPTQNLDDKAREHKDKLVHFKFMLEHVIVDDVYRLSQSDLQLLGIATRYY